MFINTTISPNCTLKATSGMECDNYFNMMDLSHDYILLLDTNLVIEIEHDQNTPWVQWFNTHVNMGKHCYVTPLVATEFTRPLPRGVALLQSPHPRPHEAFERAVEDLSNLLQLTGKTRTNMRNDIFVVLEACSLSVSDEIPLDVIAQDRVAFASANMTFLCCVLGNPAKRLTFEHEAHRHGFDHLLNLIGVKANGEVLLA
jgi:hypothetical protein